MISSYSYTVNIFGQRVSVETAGEAFGATPAPWVWNYDVLGQVIKANNYDYSYDSIGNRKTTGKDNAILANYTSNNLNQYAAVNTNAPSYDNEGNLLSGLTSTSALPDRPNLNFTYNAENRPIKVSQNGEVVESYDYDHEGRRVKKGNTIIIYDGYNAIAEYDLSSKSLKESYAWGLDLSNSTQGAGGVGGLLSVTDHTTQTPLTSYPTYDGNGNISEYLTEQSFSSNSGSGNSSLRAGNQELGLITAHYEYDAFGNVTKKTGSRDYIYQFSTKPFDKLTGLNYYNYRLYDPTNGRWINRDPIQEEGGSNLHGFINNNGVNRVDYLGLAEQKPEKECKIEIVAGHDSVVDKKERDWKRNMFTNLDCNRFYGIACFKNPGKAKPGGGRLWPNDENRNEWGIPGEITLSEAFIIEIGLKEQEAMEYCKDKKACCKEVRLSVTCLEYKFDKKGKIIPDTVMPLAKNTDKIAKLGCSYRNTYTCSRAGGPKWSGLLFAERINKIK